MKQLTATALGAVAVFFSVALPSSAQEKERDYLVHQGKRPIWASELRRQRARQNDARVSASESSRRTTQRGRIVQQGKAQIFIPEHQLSLVPRLNRREIAGNTLSSPQVPSRGRSVQQGKAHLWVPDTIPTVHPDSRYIADEIKKPGPAVID